MLLPSFRSCMMTAVIRLLCNFLPQPDTPRFFTARKPVHRTGFVEHRHKPESSAGVERSWSDHFVFLSAVCRPFRRTVSSRDLHCYILRCCAARFCSGCFFLFPEPRQQCGSFLSGFLFFVLPLPHGRYRGFPGLPEYDPFSILHTGIPGSSDSFIGSRYIFAL